MCSLLSVLSWSCAPRPDLCHTGRLVARQWSARRSAIRRGSSLASTASPADRVDGQWKAPWSLHDNPDAASHLNPTPDAYSNIPFTDQCTLNLQAGPGGHGCISFLREKFVEEGPPNGGDGGTGGSIFIQAVKGESSLHKLARRSNIKAGRGKNGKGKSRGGERGEDIVIKVPVGTIVREISRYDPITEQYKERRRLKAMGADAKNDDGEGEDNTLKWRREKWLLYPAGLPRSFTAADFPAIPRPRRSNLAVGQPKGPLTLDLDSPMEAPVLLAAGAVGGLGNPHFVTKSITRPKFATRGEDGMSMQVHLELKLIADIGLVGLPNAGKSTLLRSLTKSRTRVGNWAFTTLQPSVGTVVLDDFKTRPFRGAGQHGGTPRESFTIADIPGLIRGAHLDKGLGLGFLRHVERAAILGFVVDLAGADPVDALRTLWHEVGQYEMMREMEFHAESERRSGGGGRAAGTELSPGPDELIGSGGVSNPALSFQAISAKPWFVVCTKADLEDTQGNFEALRNYLDQIAAGEKAHPSGRKNAWRHKIKLIPVSAIKAEGVDRIVPAVVELLDGA